ncbi:MAG: repressor LexA, partial [Ilumatobacteraceae bacterium]
MFIDQFHSVNGYPPTIRELGAHLKMASPSTAHDFVKRMERRGL